MADRKRQHTITKAYLRRFTASSTPSALWRFDKQTGACERSNIENATVWFWAYSISLPDGTRDHRFDEFLELIETKSIPLIDRIERGDSLDREDRRWFARFIATTMRRPRALVEHFEKKAKELASRQGRIKQIVDEAISDKSFNLSPEDEMDVIRRFEEGEFTPTAEHLKAYQLEHWSNLLEHASNVILTMNWQIIKSRSDNFLTSDMPAFCRPIGDPDNKRGCYIAPGRDEAELTFPLSNRYLFRAIRSPCASRVEASKSRVSELNARIIRNSWQYVLAHADTPAVRALFDQYRQHHPAMP